MFARALLAFLALPGVVAFAVPVAWLLASSHTRLVQPLGLVPLVAGTVGLLSCVRAFYVSGKGTLAPWAPPVNLVVVGLYRYTRNPMYISVTVILRCPLLFAFQPAALMLPLIADRHAC